MVIDTSALLAIFFDEPHGAWCARQLERADEPLRMSTVNLAEGLILAQDRAGEEAARAIEDALKERAIEFVAPDVEQARIAALALHRFPLNLGDCFAYALAMATYDRILTLDRDFRSSDVPVVIPPR